jgi:ATPase subunit of ABC transporter with duplicated ATPase domains
VHKKTLLLLLAFAVLVDFTGCVSMSAQARRERAYRHYVQKQMKQRQKAMARAQKAANRDMRRKIKNLQPSEPQLTTSVEDVSSETMPSVFDPVAPSPASASEPVAPPVTVSASDAIATQNPEQPSRP